MQFHMNNPQMSWQGILSRTDSFINVIAIHIRPSSHHHIILSLAKCLLFMDISWGAEMRS